MKPVVLLPFAGALALGSCFAQTASTPGTQAQPASAATTAAAEADAPRAPIANTLMANTAVALRLGETMSSEDAHVGQQVPFEVTEDVIVQGVTIVSKGSPAVGTVTQAEPKKRMGRGGKLDIVIDSVRLVDGTKVQLSATKNTKGGGHVGAMTTAMVATSIVFFPAAPLFLFMHGKDIVIPKGTAITAFVQGDTKLDMARLQNPTGPAMPGTAGAPAAPGAALTPASAPANTASLQIESSVPGADIEIDGAFAGNTPSTLSVSPGQHTVAVKKKGYADWTRTMNVSGSAVHVTATMEVK